MGAGVDKLFLEVAGRPVVAHTWQRFDDAQCIDEIILVVRDGMQKDFAGTGGEISFSKTVSHRRRRRGTAGLGLERPGGAFAGSGNCGHPGRGAALHERGIDCGHRQGGAGNRRGRGRAAGDGHHQGIRRRQIHSAHAGPFQTVVGADAADVSRRSHPPRDCGSARRKDWFSRTTRRRAN